MSLGNEMREEMEIDSQIEELKLYRLADKGIWTTINGAKCKIEDMSNSHLKNTINFLKRGRSDWGDSARTLYIQKMTAELESRQKIGKVILATTYIQQYNFDDPPSYYPPDGFGDFDVSQS